MKAPDGFVEVDGIAARGFARAEAVAWVDQALARWGSLDRAARHADDALALAGRGAVHAVPAPPGGRWVVRRYRRGGWVAPVLGDRYLRRGEPRPLVETRASETARARGIATPRVVAAILYPSGLFYRADLVTEWVPDSVDLAVRLFGEPRAPATESLMAEAAAVVSRLAAAGVRHADLNAKNLLVAPDDPPRLHVLDLDRASVGPPGSLRPARMAARLERSLRKFERRTGRPLGRAAWAAYETALTAKQE